MAIEMENRTRLSRSARHLILALWVTMAVLAMGIVYDLSWHANNPVVIKTATEQATVHWIIWVGLVSLATVAFIGHSIAPSGSAHAFRILISASLAYIAIEAWHFYEHYTQRDLEIVHTLLMIMPIVTLGGALYVTRVLRRRGTNLTLD